MLSKDKQYVLDIWWGLREGNITTRGSRIYNVHENIEDSFAQMQFLLSGLIDSIIKVRIWWSTTFKGRHFKI
jgi:hypothetical protein